jgi:tetratricopeptide (TPR) repeat protein
MLETIRDYALERLEASESAGGLRRAHAWYCLGVVEDAAPRLRGDGQAQAFDRLDAELDNLRAALQYGDGSDTDLLARLVAGTGYFWLVRGHLDEARRWAESAIATSAGSATIRANILRIAARAALSQDDREEAGRYFEKAVQHAREGNDGDSLANALRGLGDIATADGDNERARSFFEDARAASDAFGDPWSSAAIGGSLAHLALTESRWADAFTLAEESAIRFRAIGDHAGEASSLINVALSALRLGRRREAQAALDDVAGLSVGDPEILAAALEALAWLLAEAGQVVASAESMGSADAAYERVGTSRGGAAEHAIRDEAMFRVRSLMESEVLEAAFRRGRNTPLEPALRRALAALD